VSAALRAVPAPPPDDYDDPTAREAAIKRVRDRGVAKALQAYANGNRGLGYFLLMRSFMAQTRIDGCGREVYGMTTTTNEGARA
jgi:hypothetical protein